MSISVLVTNHLINWMATSLKLMRFPSDIQLKQDGFSRFEKYFKGSHFDIFIKNVYLSADSKSRIAILGGHGAGKSTLLKL